MCDWGESFSKEAVSSAGEKCHADNAWHSDSLLYRLNRSWIMAPDPAFHVGFNPCHGDGYTRGTQGKTGELQQAEDVVDYVNLCLARLYRTSKQLRSAEETLTSFIERKVSLGEGDDLAIEKAYYNRACYKCLRWASLFTLSDRDRLTEGILIEGIKRDIDKAIALNEKNKEYAKADHDFDAIKNEAWFKSLVGA